MRWEMSRGKLREDKEREGINYTKFLYLITRFQKIRTDELVK